jgi:uncharacterized membrane protein
MYTKELNVPIIAVIVLTVILSVVAQICVKSGINHLGSIDFDTGVLSAYARVFFTPLVLVGTLVYVVSILLWLYSLSKVDLSFAYPFAALSHVLIALASWLLLGEQVPLQRWIGILVICVGLVVVSRS